MTLNIAWVKGKKTYIAADRKIIARGNILNGTKVYPNGKLLITSCGSVGDLEYIINQELPQPDIKDNASWQKYIVNELSPAIRKLYFEKKYVLSKENEKDKSEALRSYITVGYGGFFACIWSDGNPYFIDLPWYCDGCGLDIANGAIEAYLKLKPNIKIDVILPDIFDIVEQHNTDCGGGYNIWVSELGKEPFFLKGRSR